MEQRPILPTFYYLSNFKLMMTTALARYGDFFSAEEHQRFGVFMNLSRDAAALFVRCYNRKGVLFRADKLDYPELDLGKALTEIEQAGLISYDLNEIPLTNLLALMTVSEMRQHLNDRSTLRSELIHSLSEHDGNVRQWLTARGSFLLSGYQAFFPLQILFFCNAHQSMTEFVLVDLGRLCFPPYSIDDNHFFKNREALDRYILWHGKAQEVTFESDDVDDWHDQAIAWLKELSHDSPAERIIYRLIRKCARHLERLGGSEKATDLYRELLARHHDQRVVERLMICLQRNKRYSEVRDTCVKQLKHECAVSRRTFLSSHLMRAEKRMNGVQSVVFSPAQAPENRLFIARSGSFLGSKAGYCIDGQVMTIEEAVLHHYQQDGWQGIHAENGYWLSIVYLLAWDVLFAPVSGVFQHPFQSGPLDLFRPEFYEPRKKQIAELVGQVEEANEQQLGRLVEESFANNSGFSCRLNHTHRFGIDVLLPFVVRSGGARLSHLIDLFFQSGREMVRGFPDLVMWTANDWMIIEVKGSRDRLSDPQKAWHHHLTTLGYPLFLCRVIETDKRETI